MLVQRLAADFGPKLVSFAWIPSVRLLHSGITAAAEPAELEVRHFDGSRDLVSFNLTDVLLRERSDCRMAEAAQIEPEGNGR